MKIYLIGALLCMVSLSNGASIQRLAREAEGIIGPIVEEILKVELQSELKRNSEVEANEEAPIVKKITEEVIVEPVVSRTIEDGSAQIEEKQPEIVEIVAVKEIIPEPVAAIRNVEPAQEIVEKVEIIAIKEEAEKPIDNFRTESVPSIEMPVEIIKETVVIEPVSELRQEPVAAIVIKEEEMVRPMIRNVIKEQIPQVEELRIVPEEVVAIKDTIPEPVPASNIVEPVVEIEPQVKTVEVQPVIAEIKEKIAVIPEIKEVVAIIPEIKTVPEIVAVPAAIVPEIKAEEPIVEVMPGTPMEAQIKKLVIEMIQKSVPEKAPETMPDIKKIVPEVAIVPVVAPVEVMPEVVPEIVPEIKKIVPEVKQEIAPETMPVIPENEVPTDDTNVESRQGEVTPARPGIIQTIQDTIQNSPIGQLLNRNPPAPAPAAAEASDASETLSDTPAETVAQEDTAATARPNVIQQAVQNVQSTLQNFLNPNSNNAAAPADSQQPNIIQAVQQAVSGAVSGVVNTLQSGFRPQSANEGEAQPTLLQNVAQAGQNILNAIRPTTQSPSKTGDSPAAEEVPETPQPAAVAEKSAEPESQMIVDPVVVQKEITETQKVDEETENLVKN